MTTVVGESPATPAVADAVPRAVGAAAIGLRAEPSRYRHWRLRFEHP